MGEEKLDNAVYTIRGYAELYRQGAAAGPEETASAMRRIELEATRMSDLVEDLLHQLLPGHQRRAGRRRHTSAAARPSPQVRRDGPAGERISLVRESKVPWQGKEV